MSLLQRQTDAVLREYDKIQIENKHELDLRKSEVYSRIPEYEELDSKIATDSINWVIASIAGGTDSIEDIKKSNQRISKRREELLLGAGFPADYLDPVYRCSKCKDTGFVGNEKCECFKKMLVNQLYTASNIKNAVACENFATFSFDYYSDKPEDGEKGVSPLKNMQKAVDTARNFVVNFDGEFSNLLIYGETGVGKTFLCNCIAKELMDSGHSVIYQTEYEFFDAIKAHAFATRNDDDTVDEKFACLLDCDLLIIDDLGAELTNSFTNSELFRIINERILCRRSTVISTNLKPAEIKRDYSDRIFSRIAKDYTLLKIFGKDIRFSK